MLIVNYIRVLPVVFFQAEFQPFQTRTTFSRSKDELYCLFCILIPTSTFSSTSLPFVNLPSPLSTTVSPLESSKFCQPPLTPPAPAATPQPSRIITCIDHIRKHSRQNQNHKGYSQIRPYPETTERYRSSEIGRETAWCWFLDSLYLGERKRQGHAADDSDERAWKWGYRAPWKVVIKNEEMAWHVMQIGQNQVGCNKIALQSHYLHLTVHLFCISLFSDYLWSVLVPLCWHYICKKWYSTG